LTNSIGAFCSDRAHRLFAHHQVSDLDGALAVRAHHMRLDHQQHAGLERERQQLAFDHGAGQVGARRLDGHAPAVQQHVRVRQPEVSMKAAAARMSPSVAPGRIASKTRR